MEQKKEKRNVHPILFTLKEALKYALICLVFIAAAHYVMLHCIINAYIPSKSMVPTLNVGNCIVGNRMVREYHRGDIAIFLSEQNKLYIKRVIGVGGDHIEIKDHAVYRNGEKLKEPYIKEKMDTEKTLVYDVPSDCYFLLGDNRNKSYDSRFWKNPYVKKQDMQAKAIFRYLPQLNLIH